MKDLQQQFSEAYKQHSDALFRYCFFKLNNEEAAKDLLQEAFVRAWKYAMKGDDIGNIRAFLYKILGNLIIDEYRRHKPPESLEVLHEEGFDPVSADDTDRWIDAIDGKQALQLLKQIPETYSEVLFMRYVEGLSLKEIADIQHESENAIAVRIHRGLGKVKKLFNHEK